MYKMFLLAYKIVSETRNETCENTDDTIFPMNWGIIATFATESKRRK